MNYERGLSESTDTILKKYPNHKMQCLAGIARTSIRCGDSRRGVSIAIENDSPRYLRKECAEILENMKVIKIFFCLINY